MISWNNLPSYITEIDQKSKFKKGLKKSYAHPYITNLTTVCTKVPSTFMRLSYVNWLSYHPSHFILRISSICCKFKRTLLRMNKMYNILYHWWEEVEDQHGWHEPLIPPSKKHLFFFKNRAISSGFLGTSWHYKKRGRICKAFLEEFRWLAVLTFMTQHYAEDVCVFHNNLMEVGRQEIILSRFMDILV